MRPTLKKIKAGALARGMSMARVSVSAGMKAASHTMGNWFADEKARPERFKRMIVEQMELLTRELGQLKGSLMKAGQMLSVVGEHFLPPEANAILKTLQNRSPTLAWKEIEKALRAEWGPKKMAELEIDREPIAAASLGQVYRARRKRDGRILAVKVQYPGVDRAIEGDIRTLRGILAVTKLVPKGPKFDALFEEVRDMLQQEVDYRKELRATDEFRAHLAGDARYVVPETFPEYSTGHVLVTSYEEGVGVDSAEVAALPQARRNALGVTFIELYFREVFRWRVVQTDPHFGNYRIRLGRDGAPDQLVCLDFGAIKRLDAPFFAPYLEMTRGSIFGDEAQVARAAREFGMVRPDDPPEFIRNFVALCFLICEPFAQPPNGADYDFGASDLPKRAAAAGAKFAFSFRLRPPPSDVIFLDRKMGGVFIFLSVLRARLSLREMLIPYLESADAPARKA